MEGDPAGAAQPAAATGPEENKPFTCTDCGQPFKNAQGLAGHRRLAHSASKAAALEKERRGLDERQRALKGREVAVAHAAEAARTREAGLAQREQAVREAEQVTELDRVRGIVGRRVTSLPEVTTETILQVRGRDYSIHPDGRLVHRIFPAGEKTSFEEGAPFRFKGRAYRIRERHLELVPTSELLAAYLGEEE